MPRGPRLDAAGTLHHVMVRGIERRPTFRDDRDRTAFLQRLAAWQRAEAAARARGLTVQDLVVPDFVTPHDLEGSQDLERVGRLGLGEAGGLRK